VVGAGRVGKRRGGGGLLTSVGQLTGLVASVLLLAQVLMARVPVLERAAGQDRLAAWHRLVGFTSFNLMLAHVGLITWGYAAGRIADTPGTLWDLTTMCRCHGSDTIADPAPGRAPAKRAGPGPKPDGQVRDVIEILLGTAMRARVRVPRESLVVKDKSQETLKSGRTRADTCGASTNEQSRCEAVTQPRGPLGTGLPTERFHHVHAQA